MSFKRSPLRAGLTAAAFLLPALAPAAAATAAVTPSVFAPMQHVAGSTPFFISHGGVHFADTTSTNWAGEAATGSNGAFTSVSTTFVQPKVTCSSGDTYSAFWVGLDGYSSDSVEQTGTEADCDGKTAEYSAWYEMYPADPVTYSNTVKAGDTIVETVSYTSSNKYTLYLDDETQGWSKSTSKSGSYDRSSAEVIAEAPYDGEVLPLANFGTVSFTSSTVNGSSLSSSDPTSINMESSSGALEATTNALSGGSFSITWNSK